MQVTFISPYYHNIWESLGIAYIASYCKKHYKGELRFNFFHGNFDTQEQMLLGAFNSDVVAFSTTTATHEEGLRIAKEIRNINKNCRIVFGGWHVTATKFVDDVVDQIVIGEGEKAFLSILLGNDDKIIEGTKLPFIDLCWPDRKLIRNDRTLELCKEMCGKRIASIQTIRGCKRNCAMCAESSMTGIYHKKNNPIRVRDCKDVLNEIDYLDKEYNIDYFKFVDPTWTADKDSVISFCKEKIKRGNKIPYEAMVHAAYCDKEILYWMSKSGCDQMDIGVESGDRNILKDIRKGVTKKQIRNIFKLAKEFRIKRRGFFLIGFPNDTEDTIKTTLEFSKELEPDVFGVTILSPLPGSDFYDREKFKDVDWKTGEYSNDFWNTDNLTNRDLKYWQSVLTTAHEEKVCWHNNKIKEMN